MQAYVSYEFWKVDIIAEVHDVLHYSYVAVASYIAMDYFFYYCTH